MTKNVYWPLYNVPLVHARLKKLLTDFRSIKEISKFIKIRLVEADLFRADGRTDMTKLIAAFRNFTKAPNNLS